MLLAFLPIGAFFAFALLEGNPTDILEATVLLLGGVIVGLELLHGRKVADCGVLHFTHLQRWSEVDIEWSAAGGLVVSPAHRSRRGPAALAVTVVLTALLALVHARWIAPFTLAGPKPATRSWWVGRDRPTEANATSSPGMGRGSIVSPPTHPFPTIPGADSYS